MKAGGTTGGPPVLVLGAGQTALGVVRLLGRAGITAFVGSDEPGPVRWSRWHRPAPRRYAGDCPSSLADWLETLGLETAVLIPCSDHSAREVAHLPVETARRFPSSSSDARTLAALTDKGSLSHLLADFDVPHPTTLVVTGPEDAAGALARMSGAAFIKPRDSQAFSQRSCVKGLWVEDDPVLSRRLDELADQGFAVVVQEYLPGGSAAHYFVEGFLDRGGTVRGLFARRRMRMYPLDFGNSSAMTSIPLHEVDAPAQAVLRLLTGTGFRGIFSAEFMKDEWDGVLKLLEVNTRSWWYVELAARCGLDVVSMAYRDALEEPVETCEAYETGRRLVFPSYDIRACLHEIRRGEPMAEEMLRSWWGADGVYPMPEVAAGLRKIGRLVGGRRR